MSAAAQGERRGREVVYKRRKERILDREGEKEGSEEEKGKEMREGG
jgi:hypothetical protein